MSSLHNLHNPTPGKDSVIHIGALLPDIMSTYGDDGNALVLRERLRRRGYQAEIIRITLQDDVPSSCDIYTMGGGCLLYTSPSPRDLSTSRMPSSA